MKVYLKRRELHLIRLWWLSCEDMMIPEGTCKECELREECEIVRKKLYGKKGGIQLDDKMATLNTVEEEPIQA